MNRYKLFSLSAIITYIVGVIGLIATIHSITMGGIYADKHHTGGAIQTSEVLFLLLYTVLSIASVGLLGLALNTRIAHDSQHSIKQIKNKIIMCTSFSIATIYVYFFFPVVILYAVQALRALRQERKNLIDWPIVSIIVLSIAAPAVSIWQVFTIR